MLLNDIYYQAGEVEAQTVGKPNWVRLHNPAATVNTRRGPRRLVGQALINLGRAIAAEPGSVATAKVRVSR